MPGTMERNNITPLLFLLLALPHFCAFGKEDRSELSEKSLKCITDYDKLITCTWDSTNVSEQADAVCKIDAEMKGRYLSYKSSCQLKPVDVSRPTLQECTMDFQKPKRCTGRDTCPQLEPFQILHNLSMTLRCNHLIQSVFFKPADHIKLNPPPQPDINSSTVFLTSQADKRTQIPNFDIQLQWKQDDQSWNDPSAPARTTIKKQCKENCAVELDTDLLVRNQRYEARSRTKVDSTNPHYKSTWSDWSPTTSWVSTVGKEKPTPTPEALSDVIKGTLGIVACVVMFVIIFILHKSKTTWIYIVKNIRPIPDPGKSSVFKDQNFQNQMGPYFTSKPFSVVKTEEIISVEVTSKVDAITRFQAETREMKTESSFESTSSGFSNPSYSHFCPLPPISVLTAGNLEACHTDTPYGPVKSQSDSKTAEAERYEAKCRDEILQLLSGNRKSSELTPVISEYEKIERHQVERTRFQSLDSGVCSGEEVSQESLEPDSTMTDVDEDEPEAKVERDELCGTQADIEKLFGCTSGKTSIQVCSGYEQVQKLQADIAELPSMDSGISSKGDDQESQESLEDADKSTESTGLLSFTSAPSAFFPLDCSTPSFMQPPCDFSGKGMTDLAETLALLKSNGSVKPSGDGYLPVKQEQ